MNLPNADITVVHRSDGSGTSYIWCDYLSKVSPDTARRSASRRRSTGRPASARKGNEGVAGLVKQTPGSIGYVELIYALQNKISYGAVQNLAGEWVRASTETVSNAAAAAAKNMPKDFRVSITNAPGHNVYPISSFTWLLAAGVAEGRGRARGSWSTSSAGRSPTASSSRRSSATRRCRRKSSRWRWKR